MLTQYKSGRSLGHFEHESSRDADYAVGLSVEEIVATIPL